MYQFDIETPITKSLADFAQKIAEKDAEPLTKKPILKVTDPCWNC